MSVKETNRRRDIIGVILDNIGAILGVVVIVLVVGGMIWFFWNLLNAPTVETDYYSYKGRFIKCQKITPAGLNSQTKTICVDH